MNNQNKTIAEWHNAKTDPPKKNGLYIVCSKLQYYKDKEEHITSIVRVISYATDLYKVDKFDFADKKDKSGWYSYDAEWGYFERNDILYWMELPKTPIESR